MFKKLGGCDLNPESARVLADEVFDRGKQLAGADPSPLRQSLALTVAVFEADLRLRQAACASDSHPALQANLNQATKRYLAAARLLAVLQRIEESTPRRPRVIDVTPPRGRLP